MDQLLQDLKFGVRLLWKDKAFSLTVLLTLMICVAANVAIFTIVYSVILRPLPVPEAHRILLLYNSYPNAGVERAATSIPDYYDRLREVKAFEEQAIYDETGFTIGGSQSAERVTGALATPSFFRVWRVAPLVGRVFREDEGEVGKQHVVVLSAGLWQRLFGGDRGVIGRELRLNGVPHTVVGVMPDGFKLPSAGVQLWTPLAPTPQEKSDESRHNNSWTMIGRLAPGSTLEQARQQVDALNARNDERFPQFREILRNAGFHTPVVPLHEQLVRDVKAVLFLLWGGVLFVLLIGCVNLTNLAIVRASGRLKELATRHSLGAGRARIARQLLTEGMLLALGGGAAGLILGIWLLGFLSRLFDDLPRGHEIHVGGIVIAAVAMLSIIVGLVIGAVPVAGLLKMNLQALLRDEGRSGTSGRAARLTRQMLVTTQVAAAFVLLIGAGLLLASFRKVLEIDPGFDPAGVETALINLPAVRYRDDSELAAFVSRALERLRPLPGMQAVAATSTIPFAGSYSDSVIVAEGYVMKPGESVISPSRVQVTDDWFETMRIRLTAGRFFGPGDTAAAPGVVIVDERLARRFWPDADPIGRRMYLPNSGEDLIKPGDKVRWLRVVGVVGTVRLTALVAPDDRFGTYYLPYAQDPTRTVGLAMRAAGDGRPVLEAVRREISALDPELPLFDVQAMSARVDDSLMSRRVPMGLALAFGGVALLLAALGIYGVLAYQVARRRREIGIRMALGSTAPGIFRLVLGEGIRMLAFGLVAGLTGAVALGRVIQSELYDVSPLDPVVIGWVAAGLAIVALIAAGVPARRATTVDPVTALNTE